MKITEEQRDEILQISKKLCELVSSLAWDDGNELRKWVSNCEQLRAIADLPFVEYVTPTDDDSVLLPKVQVRCYEEQPWKNWGFVTLLRVVNDEHGEPSFVCKTANEIREFSYCRMVKRETIPQKTFLVDDENIDLTKWRRLDETEIHESVDHFWFQDKLVQIHKDYIGTMVGPDFEFYRPITPSQT